MSCIRIYFLVIGLVIVLVPGSLFSAQEKSEVPVKARRVLNRGIEYAKQEKWDLAIKSFEETLEKAPREPHCLLNLALACDKAGGQDLMAMLWYYAYLVALPDAENRQQIQKRKEELLAGAYNNLEKIFQVAQQLLNKVDEYYIKGNPRDLPTAFDDEQEAAVATKAAMDSADRIKVSMYECMTAMAAVVGDYEKAEAMANKISEFLRVADREKKRQHIYCAVVRHQARRGDMRLAISTAEKITDAQVKTISYLEIAKKYANCKNDVRAREFLGKAEISFRGFPEDAFTDQYYQERVKALLTLGDIAAAKQAFELLKDAEVYRPDTLKMISKAENKKPTDEIDDWVRIAKSAKSVKYSTDLSGYLNSLKGQTPDSVIYDLTSLIENIGEILEDVANRPCNA